MNRFSVNNRVWISGHQTEWSDSIAFIWDFMSVFHKFPAGVAWSLIAALHIVLRPSEMRFDLWLRN